MSNPQNKPKKNIEVVARKLCLQAGANPDGRMVGNRTWRHWHIYKSNARQILLALKRNREIK